MPDEFFKLDVHFFDHPKVIGLSEAAVVLYIASIAYANRHQTDGALAPGVAARLWPLADWHAAAVELVKAGLWEQDGEGFRVHDFLEHNRSRAERQQQRESAREAGRRRQQRWRDRHHDDPPPPDRAPPAPNAGVTGVTRSAHNGGVTSAEERREEKEQSSFSQASLSLTDNGPHQQPSVAQARPGEVTCHPECAEVFEAWKVATDHGRAKWADKRCKLVRARRREGWTVPELCEAAGGWRNSPHHRGENRRQTVYNAFELIYRDTHHVEQFLGFVRGQGTANSNGRPARHLTSVPPVFEHTGRIDL